MDKEELKEALQRAIQRRIPIECEECEITDFDKLTGGAINETWRFTLTQSLEGKPCPTQHILRRTPGYETEGLAKDIEAVLQTLAYNNSVAVAAVNWRFDSKDGLGEAYVMDYIEGETIPRKILRDNRFAAIRPALAGQCGNIAAKIHAVNPASISNIPIQDLDQQLAYYRRLYTRSTLQLPVLELAFKWLENHRPSTVQNSLVHGDFRNGNFIVNDSGIRAVLDWELAHLGDPMEDLGWICVSAWRFGNLNLAVGGFGHREQLFESYEACSGRAVDRRRVHYWEVLGTLKWGAMCMIISNAQSEQQQRTIEQAAIGRRISETELDLLEILTQDH